MWGRPFIKDDESLNNGLLDEGAVYWSSLYTLPEEGAFLTFEGGFPYSRYMSLSFYRIWDGSLSDSLGDSEFIPREGSINPFAEGNMRNDPYRYYLLSVQAGERPEDAASASENTLYDGSVGAGSTVVLVYRNYVPNEGTDLTGDIGLPRVTLHLPDGTTLQGDEACAALSVVESKGEPVYWDEAIYADQLRGVFDPSRSPPVFRTDYGGQFIGKCDFYDFCVNNPPRGSGFLLNADADYMYSFLNRQHGEVLVLRGKVPEVPETYAGEDTVFSEGQLRYWSMCSYEFYSKKVSGCLFDEQLVINDDGFYTIVTSRTEDRPENATTECGVSYIPWSEDGDGLGILEGRENYSDDGWLQVRNILPAPGFSQAIQNTSVTGDEPVVLGEFYPRGQYFSKAEFEGLGCNPSLALPYEDMQ